MRLSASVSALVLALAACGGRDSSGTFGGTVIVVRSADAEPLIPATMASVQTKAVVDQLFDYLADIGPEMNTVGDKGFTPALAERWDWASDSLSIAFHLNPAAKWHDGQPVRASDVRFTFRLFTDSAVASPGAPNLADIDSVSVRDSLTAVVWFKRRLPTQFFDAVYNTAIMPEHALKDVPAAQLRASEFGRSPIGSGRFRFVRWSPGASLELVADTGNYRGRPHVDRVVFSVTPDPVAAATKLFAGEADFFEPLRPDDIIEAAKHPDVKVIAYPGLQYHYMVFNLRDGASARPHPLFGDAGVRRALTMGIDRAKLVKNVLDSLAFVGIGPTPRALWSVDSTIAQLPYDTAHAARLLDSLGWQDANHDGVREKNGRPLKFSVMFPSSSKNKERFAVLIQEQLRPLGVQMAIEKIEPNVQAERIAKHAFDASLNGLQADPNPASLRQSWGTPGSKIDGSNYASYSNRIFDASVDSAVSSFDLAKARAHYRRAYETIVGDAPAVWLYEPRQFAGVHKRLRTGGIRADGWWYGLAEWSIPSNEQIERDKVGLAPKR